MKVYFTLLLVLHAVIVFGQNSLSGKITDKTTHEPLVGVIVALPDLRLGATTDADGRYQISNMPKGRFLVQVRLVGYGAVVQTVAIDGATTYDVALSPSVTELGTVVVTGVSASTEARRNPVPTTVVSNEELLQQASSNVVDAIAHTPGISQISTGPAISKPVIRGLSGNRVVTLNNGMRQEGQQWGDEHGIEIDENSIDRAEIIKGPGSIMYGSDAMAGVVNFIAADPVEEGTISGSYTGNYQTNNHLFSNSIMNAGNLNGYNWQVRLSQKMAGNYRNRYDGRVYNSGFGEFNGNGYVGINKSWGFSHLNFSSFNQNLGLVEGERDQQGHFLKLIDQNGISEEVPVTEDDLSGYGIDVPKQRVKHMRVASQNNFILGASRVTLNLDWQRNQRQEFGNILVPSEKSLYFDLNTLSYDLKYFLPEMAGWNTTFGGAGMRQNNQNRGVEFLIPEYRLTDVGFFAFTQKQFETLHLSGGLRFDHRTINSDELLLTADEEPTTDPADADITKFNAFKRNFSNLSASAGFSYDFSEKLTGKFNVARGFRAPNIAELASNGRHEGTFRYEIGNPDLNPETSLQFDAGLSLHTDHLTLDVTGFHNSIQQYIFPEKLLSVLGGDSISDPEDPAPTFKFVQGDARLYGGEVSFDIHPHPLDWLHFDNSFSLVRAKQLHQPDSTTNLPFIPAPRLQSELRINFKPEGQVIRNWFAQVQLEHYFDQKRVFSAYGTETPTPGYTLFNIGGGFDVSNQNKARLVSVYITANNLFNKAYQNHLSRLKYAPENPATGRTGVFNMGRNISIRVVVPITFRHAG